jgi:hypothetical protein
LTMLKRLAFAAGFALFVALLPVETPVIIVGGATLGGATLATSG